MGGGPSHVRATPRYFDLPSAEDLASVYWTWKPDAGGGSSEIGLVGGGGIDGGGIIATVAPASKSLGGQLRIESPGLQDASGAAAPLGAVELVAFLLLEMLFSCALTLQEARWTEMVPAVTPSCVSPAVAVLHVGLTMLGAARHVDPVAEASPTFG